MDDGYRKRLPYQKPRMESQQMLAQTALACGKGPGDADEEQGQCFPDKDFAHDKTS